MRKILLVLLLALTGFLAWFFIFKYNYDLKPYQQLPEIKAPQIFPTPTPPDGELPISKTLPGIFNILSKT